MPVKPPNNRQAAIRPVKPSWSGAAAMSEMERFDHARSFQRVAPQKKAKAAAAGATGTMIVASGGSGSGGGTNGGGGITGSGLITVIDRFVGDGTTTVYALSQSAVAGTVDVAVGGVDQDPSGSNGALPWTVAASVLTFTGSAPDNTANIKVGYQTMLASAASPDFA